VTFNTLNRDARHIFFPYGALKEKCILKATGRRASPPGLEPRIREAFDTSAPRMRCESVGGTKKPRRDTTKRHKWGAARSPICAFEGGLRSGSVSWTSCMHPTAFKFSITVLRALTARNEYFAIFRHRLCNVFQESPPRYSFRKA